IRQALGIELAFPVEAEIVENTAHQASKIDNTKIYNYKTLTNEIDLRLILSGHANRPTKLSQVEEHSVVAGAHAESIPAQLIRHRGVAVVQLHANAHHAFLADIKDAIEVGIAKYAAFNDVSATNSRQQRRNRHGAEDFVKAKGKDGGALWSEGVTQYPNVGQTRIKLEGPRSLVSEHITCEGRPRLASAGVDACNRKIRREAELLPQTELAADSN